MNPAGMSKTLVGSSSAVEDGGYTRIKMLRPDECVRDGDVRNNEDVMIAGLKTRQRYQLDGAVEEWRRKLQ